MEAAIAHLAESRHYVPGEHVGLNGQMQRKKMLEEVIDTITFDAAVETGTWLGDTTGYLATLLQVPVYSCELHNVPHVVAKSRLAGLPRVHLARADSRDFLRQLSSVIPATSRCLFYLDAHWHSDLPLAEELRIIAAAWREYVVLVDDFRVPGDPGYRFDSYGRGRTLSLEDFGKVFRELSLVALFPSAPSATETGYKRGCVVLSPAGTIAEKLRALPTLATRGRS